MSEFHKACEVSAITPTEVDAVIERAEHSCDQTHVVVAQVVGAAAVLRRSFNWPKTMYVTNHLHLDAWFQNQSVAQFAVWALNADREHENRFPFSACKESWQAVDHLWAACPHSDPERIDEWLEAVARGEG